MPTAVKDPLSPVEERHVDYILEEEFCVNPDFVFFFIAQARGSAPDPARIREPIQEHGCKAVRSVTTGSGESDVLVTYRSTSDLPVAILIEDKLRAGFQPDQPSRYRQRGEAGKGNQWSDYWTCLIAHSKYAASPNDFDTVITLQDLQGYFVKRSDARSQFRARTLEQAIYKYESNGLQKKDDDVTRFRHLYAKAFEAALPPEQWWHQPARDAWWGDTWFDCTGKNWPKSVLIRHQAEPGRIQLIFPLQDENLFRTIAAERAARSPQISAPHIEVVPVGKSKLAFQLRVAPVVDFTSTDAPFEEFFAAIEYLRRFYERCSDMLPEKLRIEQPSAELRIKDPESRGLYTMLLAYMRSTVTQLGTAMPFPLPDLAKLTSETPENDRYFASLGLMGGFHLQLLHDGEGRPFISASHSSRQWGGYSVEHKITASEVLLLNSENRL